MTTAPALCPHCLAENRVATVAGPTCTHAGASGVNWWPEWWFVWHAANDEAQRLEWLEARNKGAA